MSLAAWGQDFGLLFGGLWKGFLDLVGWAGTFSPADVLSWTLLLSLAYLIFSDWMGVERCKRWTGVFIYTTIIYLTLPFMWPAWRVLYRYTGGRINMVGGIATVVLGTWSISYLVFRRRERRWRVYVALIFLGIACYVLLTLIQESPAKRLHLTEYGFLSYLTFRALRVDTGYRSAYLWGWVVAAGLGALDEGIQACLPNRAGQLADVGLNALSCGLGMVAVMLVASRE
jgi:hypothetical protein